MTSEIIPVASSAGPWIATGAWGTFLTLLALLLRQVVPQWLPWLQLRSADATAKRKEKREDLASCQEQITELRTSQADLLSRFHDLELKLVGALSGYRILEADVAGRDPNSMALRHARAAISAAFTVSATEIPPHEPDQPAE